MSVTIPNVPYRIPIADDSGLISPAWVGFFKQAFLRMGGPVALSNKEIVNLVSVQTIVTLQTEVTALQARVTALEAVPTDLLLLGPMP